MEFGAFFVNDISNVLFVGWYGFLCNLRIVLYAYPSAHSVLFAHVIESMSVSMQPFNLCLYFYSNRFSAGVLHLVLQNVPNQRTAQVQVEPPHQRKTSIG